MIDGILKSVGTIPAFPATLQKVSELLRDDDYAVGDVVDVIKYDQAIAANILKISNSAYFGARKKINTIRDAVVYLGQQQLLRAIETAGISIFYRRGGEGYVSQSNAFWEHAVAVALMSQILSKKLQNREDPVLYTAALLHDVGKVIMGEYVHKSFGKIMNRVRQGNCSFLEAEEECIGINHADLGGRIAEHWNFPTDIRDAIAYHHRPDLLTEQEQTKAWLVYLSDQACLMIGIDGGADTFAQKGLESVIRHFNLRMIDLEQSLIHLLEDLGKAKELINVR